MSGDIWYLQVFGIFRIDSVEFAVGRRGSEERADEELREPVQRTLEVVSADLNWTLHFVKWRRTNEIGIWN